MSLFDKRLMKWREPKIKGMITPKNILAAIGLILIVSIPFGFLGGNGKFNISICFIALGFMSLAAIGFLIVPLLPGTQIQLKEDAIVRLVSNQNQKSAYKDIDCIYFERDCSYSWENKKLIINVHQKSIEGPNFTNFKVIMKSDVIVDGVLQFSYTAFRSVHQFAVPESVNAEQVLQILRDKGVKVVEGPLPS
ncbi:MAG: hypothetical protein ACREDS_02360 [Limisphaerales bacterium]